MAIEYLTPENVTQGVDLITYADMYTGGMLGLVIPLMIFTIVFSVSTFTLKPHQSALVGAFITLVFAIWFRAIGLGSDKLILGLFGALVLLLWFSFTKRND